ncbi:MAG: SGNH/GDSL hydrolase family protein [Deltaproteobacteria bacterium]|nr:SGNH/GDSL hydrolase family protein [Deltaproteobacteria bacterium]
MSLDTSWWMQQSRRVLVNLATVVLIFLAAELTLGLFIPDFRETIIPDDVVYFRYKPDSGTKDYTTLMADQRVVSYAIGHYGERIVRAGEAREYEPPYILSFGDSTCFGHGVEGDETYEYFLEELLDGRVPVINFGVSGYNGFQSAMIAKEQVERFKPRLILMQWDPNDDDPMFPVQPDKNVGLLGQTRVERLFYYLMSYGYLGKSAMAKIDRTTGRSMITPTTFDALRLLVPSLRRHQVAVIALYDFLPRSLKDNDWQEILRKNDIPLATHEMTYYRDKDYLLDSSVHLNAAGNARVAEELYKIIRERFADRVGLPPAGTGPETEEQPAV